MSVFGSGRSVGSVRWCTRAWEEFPAGARARDRAGKATDSGGDFQRSRVLVRIPESDTNSGREASLSREVALCRPILRSRSRSRSPQLRRARPVPALVLLPMVRAFAATAAGALLAAGASTFVSGGWRRAPRRSGGMRDRPHGSPTCVRTRQECRRASSGR